MNNLLLVGLGGAAGAMARFGFGAIVQRSAAGIGWPVGVLVVNVLGCFLMGLLLPLAGASSGVSADPSPGVQTATAPSNSGAPWRLPVLVGFLGAFTTFSTFAADTVELGSSRGLQAALINIVLHNVLGLTAFCLGLWLGRAVSHRLG